MAINFKLKRKMHKMQADFMTANAKFAVDQTISSIITTVEDKQVLAACQKFRGIQFKCFDKNVNFHFKS